MPKERLTERPILFSGPMVRAIMEGRKTQTRRIVRVNPRDGAFYLLDGWPHRSMDGHDNRIPGVEEPYRCPYGQIGDRLWVRETWAGDQGDIRFAADGDSLHGRGGGKWRPSIFMSRWASRLTLEITDIRVQQLQDITETDILSEGVTVPVAAEMTGIPWSDLPTLHYAWKAGWDHINGARASYESNPWVWALNFRRLA